MGKQQTACCQDKKKRIYPIYLKRILASEMRLSGIFIRQSHVKESYLIRKNRKKSGKVEQIAYLCTRNKQITRGI